MSERQASLFKYSFTRKVYHRNTSLNVSVGDYVTETGIHKCCSCSKSFMSKQGHSSHVLRAHLANISINKSEAVLKVIHAKIEKVLILAFDKLVMSVVENNYSFSTAPKKHENHSGAIDLTVD